MLLRGWLFDMVLVHRRWVCVDIGWVMGTGWGLAWILLRSLLAILTGAGLLSMDSHPIGTAVSAWRRLGEKSVLLAMVAPTAEMEIAVR